MGNCMKPLMGSGEAHEDDIAEEAKPLMASTFRDKAVVISDDSPIKKAKKVRFMVQEDNAAAAAVETTMRPLGMKRGVRVKVVLTQSELKQILNRANIYHQPSPPLQSSSVDQVSSQKMVKCRKSRRSSVMCGCRCSWNPALQTIPEWSHY